MCTAPCTYGKLLTSVECEQRAVYQGIRKKNSIGYSIHPNSIAQSYLKFTVWNDVVNSFEVYCFSILTKQGDSPTRLRDGSYCKVLKLAGYTYMLSRLLKKTHK